ncbi:hypothetical protein PLUA15_180194 [Pseudomonas lundensis]|uniref:Uncharacterized protein n=1 Tax=Pseudomonas lundensis TaxID=86185 RepID=A0AAX2H3Y1_9PSED|nr:hypothetical protein PLUA15_180194 [Pseudomonas lundensis]
MRLAGHPPEVTGGKPYKYLFQNSMRPCAGFSWPSLKPNLR